MVQPRNNLAQVSITEGAVVTEKVDATASRHFKTSAEPVYDAWLESDKVRVWMKTALRSMGLSGDIGQIEIDPRVGGAFLFTDTRDGTEARHWGTYLELERPYKIVFTWITDESEASDPSRVVLTIQPEDDGCIATIVQEMDAKWADFVERCESGWSAMMQATEGVLEASDAAPKTLPVGP